MPEGERAHKRSQGRRRGDPAAQQPSGAARPQDIAIIDAVRAEHHREQQRDHLATGVRGPRPIRPQPDQTPRQRLDPQPLAERRDQHHPGVRNDPLVVEADLHAVQSDRLVILHHEDDLLTAGPGCREQPLKPCTGGHSSFRPGRNPPTESVDPG